MLNVFQSQTHRMIGSVLSLSLLVCQWVCLGAWQIETYINCMCYKSKVYIYYYFTCCDSKYCHVPAMSQQCPGNVPAMSRDWLNWITSVLYNGWLDQVHLLPWWFVFYIVHKDTIWRIFIGHLSPQLVFLVFIFRKVWVGWVSLAHLCSTEARGNCSASSPTSLCGGKSVLPAQESSLWQQNSTGDSTQERHEENGGNGRHANGEWVSGASEVSVMFVCL